MKRRRLSLTHSNSWNWKLAATTLALLINFVKISASDLISVSPVTSKILMVYIEDGHVDYYGANQTLANNAVYYNATNLTNIVVKTNYVIASTDDGNYSTSKNPINLGRKSKAIYYNDPYDGTKPTYFYGHKMYIERNASAFLIS